MANADTQSFDYEACLTVPAEGFASLAGLSVARRLAAHAATRAASWLLKSPLRVTLPYPLSDVPPELIRHLPLLDALRQHGYVTGVKSLRRRTTEGIALVTCNVLPRGFGADFERVERAFWRALGENVERTVWSHHDLSSGQAIRRTVGAMPSSRTLDPLSVVGFSQVQRQNHPRLALDRGMALSWIPVHSLIDGRLWWAPEQLFSGRYMREAVGDRGDDLGNGNEPVIRRGITTGVAAAATFREALLRGFLEVIERDAFMIMWLNRLAMPRIDLDDLAQRDSELQAALGSIRATGYEPYVMRLPTDFPCFACFACLVDRSGRGPSIGVGASAKEIPRDAIRAALVEAVAVLQFVGHDYLGRRYEDEDRGTLDRDSRLRYWAQDPARLAHLEFMWSGPIARFPEPYASPVKHSTAVLQRQTLSAIAAHARSCGYRMLYADLTPADLKRLGLHVVSTLVPELQPLHLDEQLPYRSGKRLSSIPRLLGYEPASALNEDPHPFP